MGCRLNCLPDRCACAALRPMVFATLTATTIMPRALLVAAGGLLTTFSLWWSLTPPDHVLSPASLQQEWVTFVLSSDFSSEQEERLICNPFDPSLAGYLDWDGRSESAPRWKLMPAASKPQRCSDPPDWLDVIRLADTYHEELSPATDALRNKTILILGDSVDRNGHLGLANKLEAQNWPSSYQDASFNGVPSGWDWNGVPFTSVYPTLNLTIYSMFGYGMDDTDEFHWQHDWRAPGRFEDRVEQLFAPFVEQRGRSLDMIVLHSGMWDLALWGRQDTQHSRATAAPLSEERMHWWMNRMNSTISKVQQEWPDTQLWLRTLHRVGTETMGGASNDFEPGLTIESGTLQNFFTDIRARQLRDLQLSVAQQHHLPVIDFAHVWEGYQHFQDKVHPQDMPGVFAYAYPLLHGLYMQQFDMDRWMFQPS